VAALLSLMQLKAQFSTRTISCHHAACQLKRGGQQSHDMRNHSLTCLLQAEK